jgi:ribosome maturation factor RimP
MKLSEMTTNAIGEVAARRGCRLLALEGAGAGRFSVLRVVLERASGEPVTVEDCEGVSREVSALLDAADEIPHRYTLEVSSAGLDRKLYCLEDAARFVGHRVRVTAENPVAPHPLDDAGSARAASPSRRFAGTLRSVDGDLLSVVDEENRKIYNVRFGDIRVARLDFLWPVKGNSKRTVFS